MKNYSVLIVLILGLLLVDCKPDDKKTSEQASAEQMTAEENTHSEQQSDSEKIEKAPNEDALTLNDRMANNGEYLSHVSLDFAVANDQVSDTAKFVLIDKASAISVMPDSDWMEKAQAKAGENWVEIISDHDYYTMQALDTLKVLGIPNLTVDRAKRYIKFKKQDETIADIDLHKIKDAWGLVLFNGTDVPVFWSSTDIDKEIETVFNFE